MSNRSNSLILLEVGETSANESLSQIKKSSNLTLLLLVTALINTFGADIDKHKPRLILPILSLCLTLFAI